jgi:hypothetical protein
MNKIAGVALIGVIVLAGCRKERPVYTMPPVAWEVCSMPDGWMVGRLVNHDPPPTFVSPALRGDFGATDKALATGGDWIPLLEKMRRDCRTEFPIPTFTAT